MWTLDNNTLLLVHCEGFQKLYACILLFSAKEIVLKGRVGVVVLFYLVARALIPWGAEV
jgi:hypothetical protein